MTRKRAIILFVIGILLAGITCSVVLYKTRKDSTKTTLKSIDSEAPSDFYAPTVEEVATQFSDPAERYREYMGYADLKRQVGKTDEAKKLYEAAANESVDKTRQKAAQYQLYLIAVNSGDTDGANYYLGLIGEDYFAKKGGDYEE